MHLLNSAVADWVLILLGLRHDLAAAHRDHKVGALVPAGLGDLPCSQQLTTSRLAWSNLRLACVIGPIFRPELGSEDHIWLLTRTRFESAVQIDMVRSRVLCAFCCLVLGLAAISFADQPKGNNPDYSKEAFIINSTETHVRFRADGTAERVQTTSVKIQSQAGAEAWGVLGADYAADYEHVDVRFVRVHKADGNMIETPNGTAQDLPAAVTRTAPMYSDLKQKQIPVKALGVGDTLEYEFAYTQDKPLVPGQFWFTYDFTRKSVVLKEVLEVRCPAAKQPKVASTELKPTVKDEAEERVFRWETAHVEPTTAGDAEESSEDEDRRPSVQISTFASWQQVGEWYAKLALPQGHVTPKIQAKADELVRGLSGGEARIQAIYNFVSTKVRYVGLDFGIGRYQPHSAEEVLENEYGDCKDKHTLLAALLKAEGFDAWPVLIPTATKLVEDMPSPGQFDHVITIVAQGKDYVWLDSTPQIAPYRMLLAGLRDKQALVVRADTPILMKTPAAPPFAVLDHLDMRGALNSEGTFKGHGELTLRGDNEVVYREAFHMSARAKWQEVLQTISYRLGFGGEVSNVQVDDPDATEKPFHLSWDYERKKYGDWDNRQISPPTGGMPIIYINEEKKPASPIQVGSVGDTLYTTETELPSGSTIDVPANVDIATPFAVYHAKYSFTSRKLICERSLTIRKREVAVGDWQAYVKFEKEVRDDFNRMISVAGSGADKQLVSAADNSEAGELVQNALQDLQNQQTTAAEDKLDKARKINAHQTNLNATYGSVYMMQGKMEEGIDSFRKELKEHPENLRVARWFAQMLVKMHREDEAMDAYRAVLKTSPEDIDANSELGRMLVEKAKWKDAQPVLEKVMKLRPDSVQAAVWYGQSCLKNGKVTEGTAALTKGADGATDPATLSAVATALVEEEKSHDLARKAIERAVEMVEEETGKLTLSDITAPQIKKMNELAQIWDAMGWVAFKTGDLPVAERYEQAAWLLSQEPAAGDHLGQIYEKEGKLPAALEAYSLAQARNYPVVAGLDDRLNALRKRMGTAHSHQSRTQASDNDRLQNLRIVKIPRGKPLTGSADFLVLFVNGRPTEVKPLGGDVAIRSLGETLKDAKFNTSFPDDGPEHVVRQGILSCSVYDPKCMFLMMLPADASANSRLGIPIRAGETELIQLHP